MRLAVGLGSSMGDRRRTLELALCQLDATPGLALERVSRWVRTPPMQGGTATGWFLNGVALFACELEVHAVLARCRALEDQAGRRRARWWGDRPLDLDLLLAEGITTDEPDLRLPHPGIPSRPFVYGPLREVWPEALGAAEHVPNARPTPVFVGMCGRDPRHRGGALGSDHPKPVPADYAQRLLAHPLNRRSTL